MITFEKLVENILNEAGEMGGDIGADMGQAMGGMPATDSSQNLTGDMPAAPPQKEEKTFDKPYKELAKILYKALEINMDELSPEFTDMLYELVPNGEDSIETDEQGSKIFGVVEDILKDNNIDVMPAEER